MYIIREIQEIQDLFGEPFGWALATTKDFVDYKDYGESLKRGTDEEADQFIYAGSVFETEAGFQCILLQDIIENS